MTEPTWLATARQSLGLREAPGPANNPTIMGWAKRLGMGVLGAIYNADSVPWCGLFVARCIADAGLVPPKIALRAKSWADWGSLLRPERLAPGAILVFEREGGGHVGFYHGEDATHYHVLGGNQSDSVSIMRLEKKRCIATRWPKGEPVIGGPRILSAMGAPISRREA